MQYLIPEGVVGHNPNFRIAYPFNRPLANALLDQFGYKIGADGYRTLPNGQAFFGRFHDRPGRDRAPVERVLARGV